MWLPDELEVPRENIFAPAQKIVKRYYEAYLKFPEERFWNRLPELAPEIRPEDRMSDSELMKAKTLFQESADQAPKGKRFFDTLVHFAEAAVSFARNPVSPYLTPVETLAKTDPDWIAMDLFSQAEHDVLAQAVLLTPDAAFADAVEASMDRQIESMPRKDIIRQSLANRGAIIVTRDLEEACRIADTIAPEHLEMSTDDPEKWADLIHHAGAIFLGRYSSEALGDYCAGPNHVLPTSRTARFSSPLGVYDFQKRTSMIYVQQQGVTPLARIAECLGKGESLYAHAASAHYRIQDEK